MRGEGRGARGEWPGQVAGHDGAWIDPWVVTGEPVPDEDDAPVARWRVRVARVLAAVADWCVVQASRLIGDA